MSDDRSQRVSNLTSRQHGVISVSQLRELGVPRSTVSRWRSDGRIVLVHPRVYAVGHRALSRDGWWHAGELVAGSGGALTCRASCEIWRLLPIQHGPVHVISGGRTGTTTTGIRVHRTPLEDDEVTIRRGLRVTTVARAIADLAGHGSTHDVGNALDSTIRLKLFDWGAFERILERSGGRRGRRILISALARLNLTGETFLSNAERNARDALLNAGLPRPEVNAKIRRPAALDLKVDLLWRDARLIVEVDGPQHQLPYQRWMDQERDAWLTAHGFHVLRIPVKQVDARLEAVVALISRELQSRSNSVPRGGTKLDLGP